MSTIESDTIGRFRPPPARRIIVVLAVAFVLCRFIWLLFRLVWELGQSRSVVSFVIIGVLVAVSAYALYYLVCFAVVSNANELRIREAGITLVDGPTTLRANWSQLRPYSEESFGGTMHGWAVDTPVIEIESWHQNFHRLGVFMRTWGGAFPAAYEIPVWQFERNWVNGRLGGFCRKYAPHLTPGASNRSEA